MPRGMPRGMPIGVLARWTESMRDVRLAAEAGYGLPLDSILHHIVRMKDVGKAKKLGYEVPRDLVVRLVVDDDSLYGAIKLGFEVPDDVVLRIVGDMAGVLYFNSILVRRIPLAVVLKCIDGAGRDGRADGRAEAVRIAMDLGYEIPIDVRIETRVCDAKPPCPVCYRPIRRGIAGECKHTVCTDCAEQWYEQRGKAWSCPVCRAQR